VHVIIYYYYDALLMSKTIKTSSFMRCGLRTARLLHLKRGRGCESESIISPLLLLHKRWQRSGRCWTA